ncbi:MAG: hypothetical protein SPJ27_09185 [Candidatus Onthovivens sp.]|nr:hypothetical protein [Candidatus Onthovivens sp.]
MDTNYLERLVEVEQRSKSNTKRLDEDERKIEDIHSLALSIRDIATEVKLMREDLNKIDKRVLAIEDKPSKRMDLIWGYVMSAVVGGIIGYILIKLGLK